MRAGNRGDNPDNPSCPMPNTSTLTILVADVLPPDGFAAIPATPGVDALLAHASITRASGMKLEDALLALVNQPGASVAPLTARADSVAFADAVMRADPVHFSVSRDNVQLIDSHVVAPDASEMTAIGATLNTHFAGDGLSFNFPDPARGYVAIAADEVPHTTPLWAMPGANVFAHLPTTTPRINWRAITNEIQMLLHTHPVNAARETAGRPAINGLWCWGGGVQPTAFALPCQHMVARLVLARGLALAGGATLTPLPAHFSELRLAPDSSTLVVLHTPTREVRKCDAAGWAHELAEVQSHWLQPAFEAFRRGDLRLCTLVLASERVSLTLELGRPTFMRRLAQILHKPATLKSFA